MQKRFNSIKTILPLGLPLEADTIFCLCYFLRKKGKTGTNKDGDDGQVLCSEWRSNIRQMLSEIEFSKQSF